MDRLLYDYAMSHNGLPYIWGGDDSIEGLDCSGLIVEYMHSCGELDPKRDLTAQGLYDYFKGPRSYFVTAPSFGALVFYGRSDKEITHVAFGLDRIRVQEAGGGGSKTKTRQDAIEQNAYVRVRPFDHRKDIVAILKPYYRAIAA
tara:strand:+ start:9570 stop:10004 length:435 start_codon:yes stop_codon:yes gene_type:complete